MMPEYTEEPRCCYDMKFGFLFILNSILFGIGLAMDAFSVSIANALKDTGMRHRRMCVIAGTFGLFQIAMPMIGWLCVHTIRERFLGFQKAIPWIALIILLILGIKMIVETARGSEEGTQIVGFWTLMLQGVATSIDALSVGFTIAEYEWNIALVESLIIGVVTFAICMGGLLLGKTIGGFFKNKAGIIGGVILILIGIEIFVKGVFF